MPFFSCIRVSVGSRLFITSSAVFSMRVIDRKITGVQSVIFWTRWSLLNSNNSFSASISNVCSLWCWVNTKRPLKMNWIQPVFRKTNLIIFVAFYLLKYVYHFIHKTDSSGKKFIHIFFPVVQFTCCREDVWD